MGAPEPVQGEFIAAGEVDPEGIARRWLASLPAARAVQIYNWLHEPGERLPTPHAPPAQEGPDLTEWWVAEGKVTPEQREEMLRAKT